MKSIRTKLASVALGTAALCAASSGAALAGSLTQPGETVGIALGTPLPEGVYFVTTGSDGGWRAVDDSKVDLTVNIPVIAWSTPWIGFFGGRIEGYVAVPELSYGGDGAAAPFNRSYMVMYNPALLVGQAWDLGQWGLKDWGFSLWSGGYAPSDSAFLGSGINLLDEWVYNERAALTYSGDHWNLTAHAIYGDSFKNLTTHTFALPSYVNLDLTAVKTLDKWEVGAVAFGSWDVDHCGSGSPASSAGPCQAQFAVGGLVGYQFTGIELQFYGTKDVYSHNYISPVDGHENYETRLWTRVVVPLWNPPAEAPMK